MNKYKEAYERLCKKEYRYPDIGLVYIDIKILGELVEKENHKPLDYEGDGYVDGELNYD